MGYTPDAGWLLATEMPGGCPQGLSHPSLPVLSWVRSVGVPCQEHRFGNRGGSLQGLSVSFHAWSGWPDITGTYVNPDGAVHGALAMTLTAALPTSDSGSAPGR